MKTHQLAFHSTGINLCRSCYKCFSNPNDLNLHREQCETKMKRDVASPCEICGKILANPRGMQTLFSYNAQSLFPYLISNVMISHLIKPTALSKHKVSLHSEGVIFCRTCVKKFLTGMQSLYLEKF